MESKLAVGTVLDGRFRISRAVSEDAIGERFVARDRQTRKQVAVTRVKEAFLAAHRDAFTADSELASRLTHTRAVPVLAHGPLEGGGAWRVTEWCRRRRLAEALEERVLLSTAVQWGRDVAEALAHAHALGLLHRGLSPESIHLVRSADPPDRALVDDWGLSRLTEGSDPASSTGLLDVSTAAYLAPEYVQGKGFDHRSDLYALGAVLFHCVTGQPPYTGPSMKILAAHVNEPAPPPSQHANGIPAWLDEIVLALLAKDPADRPQSAEEVVAALADGATLLQDGAAHPQRVTANVAPVRLPNVAIRGAGSTRTPTAQERPADAPGEDPSPSRRIVVLLVVLGVVGFLSSFAICSRFP